MRLDTSKLVKKPELQEADTNYHKHNRFFPAEFLEKPEFMYQNHLVALKEADIELLEQALSHREAEESKRNLLASQDGTMGQANNAKGKDAKGKDAKKPAKGAVEGEKNAPKPIDVEYAEGVAAEPDYLLIEKSYN